MSLNSEAHSNSSNASVHHSRSHLPRPQLSGKSESASAASSVSNHPINSNNDTIASNVDTSSDEDDNLLAQCISTGNFFKHLCPKYIGLAHKRCE